MPESHRLQLYQRKTLTQVFSSVFCEISKNTFCYRTLWWLPLTKRSSLDVWQGSEYQFANLCVFLDNYLKCDRINNGFTLFKLVYSNFWYWNQNTDWSFFLISEKGILSDMGISFSIIKKKSNVLIFDKIHG